MSTLPAIYLQLVTFADIVTDSAWHSIGVGDHFVL